MAMTKKEQQSLADARERVGISRALAWPTFPVPQPIDVEAELAKGMKYVTGWAFNGYSRRVGRCWMCSLYSYSVDPTGDGGRNSMGSRTKETIYATEQDAWLAMIHATAREYGQQLLRMYRAAGRHLED